MPSSYTLPDYWFGEEYLLNTWLRTKLDNPNARLPLINEVVFYDDFPWVLYEEYRREWTAATEYAYFLSRPCGYKPYNSFGRDVGSGGHWKPLLWTVSPYVHGNVWDFQIGLRGFLEYREQDEAVGGGRPAKTTQWFAEEFLFVDPLDHMVGEWAIYRLRPRG